MRFFFVFVSLFGLFPVVQGQDLEVGVFGGGVYYLGDVNPSGHYKGTRLAYGILARYNIDTRWAVKLSGYQGKVKGAASGSWFLPDRELSFTSPITDISAVAEFNFFPYFTGSRKNFITPFIYAGIGVFFFKPESGGVALQPLGTEGQEVGYDGRKPYALVGLNIPFGLGVKVSLGRRFGLAAFWEMHKTFTDYIDDISKTYYLNGILIDPNDPTQYYSDPTLSYQEGTQRGNSANQDWYSFSGVTITYKFALDANKKCRDVYQY